MKRSNTIKAVIPLNLFLISVLLIFSVMLSAQNDIVEIKKLLASDAEGGDVFGNTVSISGETAIVGALGEDEGGNNAGAAYVFERDETGTWQAVQKLLASDAEAGDFFGHSLSLSGETAIVGAYQEGEAGNGAGAAYVFEQDETGAWQEVQKLLASDTEAGDQFGFSVSVSGETAIVGARFESEAGGSAGAAYVFERDETGTWQEVQKLLAGDAQAGDHFGFSISVNGETAIVGADLEGEGGAYAGAAYVFERDETGAWQEVQKLLASDAQTFDFFGRSISLSGKMAIVGAPGEDEGGNNAGAIYVFERDETGAWQEVQKLLASDAEADDLFGRSVSLSGERAIASSYEEDEAGNEAGAAYVLERDENGTWQEVKKWLAGDAQAGDNFGHSVSISGETAIVGAPLEDEGGNNAGAAYLFSTPTDDASPADVLNDIINDIIDLRDDPSTPAAATNDFDKSLDDLNDALDAINSSNIYEAFSGLEDGIEHLQDAGDDGADVSAIIDAIYALADELAQAAATEAAVYSGSSVVDDYITDGNDFLTDALDELANGNPDQAVRRLGSAYKEFQWAIQIGSAIAQGMDAVAAVNTTIANIQDLIDNGSYSSNANADLQDAIDELNDAIDDFNDDGDISAAYSDLQDAVEQLQDAEADGAVATDEINEIVDLARMLAEVKLAEAQEYAGNPATDDKITDAEDDIADAEAEMLAGNPDRAVGDYRNAWEDARIALEHGRGLRKETGSEDITTALIPEKFSLAQNYPNPFNPSTTIQFGLPEASQVSLQIYNIKGQLVTSLVKGALDTGLHTISWDATGASGQKLASGIYFYKIQAGAFTQVKKMMLIR